MKARLWLPTSLSGAALNANNAAYNTCIMYCCITGPGPFMFPQEGVLHRLRSDPKGGALRHGRPEPNQAGGQ